MKTNLSLSVVQFFFVLIFFISQFGDETTILVIIPQEDLAKFGYLQVLKVQSVLRILL
jgi:hypothetical protein